MTTSYDAMRCPDGKPHRRGICLGYTEREPGWLQLWVALGGPDCVCQAIVEENPDSVGVALIICFEPDEDDDLGYSTCPVQVYLEEPIGDRRVIDLQTGRELPPFSSPLERRAPWN